MERAGCRTGGASRRVVPEGGARRRRPRQNSEPDDDAAATRTTLGLAGWNGILDRFGGRWWQIEQAAANREPVGTVAIGEETVMPDAVETVRQGMQQETANELVGRKRHHLRLAVMPMILPAEGDRRVGDTEESGVSDGDAVGIAAEIGIVCLAVNLGAIATFRIAAAFAGPLAGMRLTLGDARLVGVVTGFAKPHLRETLQQPVVEFSHRD